MTSPGTLRLVFERQWLHALGLGALLALLYLATREPSVRAGQLGGLDSVTWLWLTAGTAIAHQGWVWLWWRTELHASLPSRALGDGAFSVYATGFSILGLSRGVPIVALALANRDTLPVDPVVMKALALLALALAAYLFYSVARYFGFRRGFGIDHFDPGYRSRRLVREGLFRVTPNAMYVFGFLLIWVPGLWLSSAAALCGALFSHAYIWVHYLATERPDMRRIYGTG